MKSNPGAPFKSERIRATPYRTFDRALCPLCEKPVKLLSFSEAADFLKTERREIENLAALGKLHRIHNIQGRIMICADSLFCLFENRPTRFLTLEAVSGGSAR